MLLKYALPGAPGCINDSLLTGLQFVEGLESFFFVSRWTMHQLVIFRYNIMACNIRKGIEQYIYMLMIGLLT